LRKLHTPHLITLEDEDNDPDGTLKFDPTYATQVDEILQHPYFSNLEEFRCRISVFYDDADIIGSPVVVFADNFRPDAKPIKEMAAKMAQLRSMMPNLARRGVLRIDEYYRCVCFN
jgi:hypothetical protein